MRPSVWINKKYKGRKYTSRYRITEDEREFVLYCVDKKHKITFESWQAAQALGWQLDAQRRG